VVFKPFPLPGHLYSSEAAQAAYCAGEKGKFWEFLDEVMPRQDMLESGGVNALSEIGGSAGLDPADFKSCIESGKYNATVQEDFDDGVAEGIYGTPTFFINGKFLAVGPMTFEDLSRTIDGELAK